LTTNLDYSEWANFLGNKALVGAGWPPSSTPPPNALVVLEIRKRSR
jgi:hypothetical protein